MNEGGARVAAPPLSLTTERPWRIGQVHAASKTAVGLRRLRSGKFDTNVLVCRLAARAMTILWLMGQRGMLGPDASVRHKDKRRRIKT